MDYPDTPIQTITFLGGSSVQKNLIIILILSIFISVFAILNAGAVTINLFFTTLEISAALVILISATIGAVIVFFLDTASKYQYVKKIKDREKKADKLQQEKKELEEKNRWYEKELARLREQNLGKLLEKEGPGNTGGGQETKPGKERAWEKTDHGEKPTKEKGL